MSISILSCALLLATVSAADILLRWFGPSMG